MSANRFQDLNHALRFMEVKAQMGDALMPLDVRDILRLIAEAVSHHDAALVSSHGASK